MIVHDVDHAPPAREKPRPSTGGESELARRANAGPHASSLAALAPVVAQRAARSGGGLPDGLRTGLERLSGRDLSGVRVHLNSPEPAQLEAHAFAQGRDIHVAPGQERHLPHEGWHAVQQMEGRVRPTAALGRTPLNDDRALEREADVMGRRAMAEGGDAVQRQAAPPASAGRGTVQRAVVVEGNRWYTDPRDIEYAARKAGASEEEAAILAGYGNDGLTHRFASWEQAIASVRVDDSDDSDDDDDDDQDFVEEEEKRESSSSESDTESRSESESNDDDDEGFGTTTLNRIANLENKIRSLAKRAGAGDSSGHGKGKKITSGHSRDRHNKGEKRKVQHKTAKIDTLQSALEAYVEAGGTEKDLDPSTVKLLNKSGMSWRKFFR